ncbi:MAG TPA: ribonuclease P protein component [Burkholderiaceae bacterium]
MSTADFERVLAARPWARSVHFAVHHLADRPLGDRLSTAGAPTESEPVDDSAALWLGTVVPKRHARRSVTRTLLKRQIRAAVDRHAAALPHGLWVVRLRAPFDKQQFPSAASEALRRAAREELDAMLARQRAAQ